MSQADTTVCPGPAPPQTMHRDVPNSQCPECGQEDAVNFETSASRVTVQCSDCQNFMTWQEAQTHLCHNVRIVVEGLLPRNDIDIGDENIRASMAEAIQEALGLAEVHACYIVRKP
jgi:endogenous inhibitor of DNA gyrase (YacG/DUF329 family)